MPRLMNGLGWQVLLWAAVAFSLVSLSDHAPFVLFEQGRPDHTVLVGTFLLTSIPAFFRVPHGSVVTRVHLGVVAAVFLAHPFAPVFERDGLLIVLALYFLVVLHRRAEVSSEATLAWTALFVSIAILETALAAVTREEPDWTKLPDYGDLIGEMKPGGVLRANLDLEVVGETGPVRFVTNALGMRNADQVGQPKSREFRIMLVGDSFIGGYRMDQRETIGKRLEDVLSAEIPRDVSVWTVVAGGPDAYARYLASHAFEFNPDLVVIGITLGNDLGASYAGSRGLGLDDDPIRAEMLPEEAYRSQSSLFVLRAHRSLSAWRWYERSMSILRPEGIVSWNSDPPTKVHFFDAIHSLGLFYAGSDVADLTILDNTFRAFSDDLHQIAGTCRANGTPCVMTLIPQRFQVDPREWSATVFDYGLDSDVFDLRLPNRRILDTCNEVGLRCVDLLPALSGTGDSLYLPRGDMHWSRLGHAVAAEALADALMGDVAARIGQAHIGRE